MNQNNIFKYFIFTICLFFSMSFSVSAKEINFTFMSGYENYEVDTDTYPYYLYFDEYPGTIYMSKNCLKIYYNDSNVPMLTSDTGVYFINVRNNIKNQQTATSISNKEMSSTKYFSNHDIKDSNGNVIFSKNIEEKNLESKFILESISLQSPKFNDDYSQFSELYTSALNFQSSNSEVCSNFFINKGTVYLSNNWYSSIDLYCLDSYKSFLTFMNYQSNLYFGVEIHFNNLYGTKYSFYKNDKNILNYSSDLNGLESYTAVQEWIYNDSSVPKSDSISIYDNDLIFYSNILNYTYDSSISYTGFGIDAFTYKNNLIHDGVNFDLDKIFPFLKFKIYNTRFDSDGNIISKSIKFFWDIYDTNRYRYFISLDGEKWSDFSGEYLELSYDQNTKLYFKVTDEHNNVLKTFTYEINDIYEPTKFNIDSSTVNKDILNDFSSENEMFEILDENDEDMTFGKIWSNIISKFNLFIDNYFGIVKQLIGFYHVVNSFDNHNQKYLTYVEPVSCSFLDVDGNPVYDVDNKLFDCGSAQKWGYYSYPKGIVLDFSKIEFLQMDNKFTVLDTTIYEKYRDEIFMWWYLSLGSYTLFVVASRIIKEFRYVLNI